MNRAEFGGEICIANVAGRQRLIRLGFGIAMAAAAVAVAAAMITAGAPRLLRLLIAPLVWLAAIGVLQYRGRT